MTPFKAQGANQALSDAVLLAECLVDSIVKHGPQAGFDVALPLYEQKMLSRSSRMVVGSREKAKELHSSLVLQPARKVQREAGGDMQKAIGTLMAKGIGAHSAKDPRGLDAVVTDAIAAAASNSSSSNIGRCGIIHNGCCLLAEAPLARRAKCGAHRRRVAQVCLLENKKSGKHKGKRTEGSKSVLDADCVRPRTKKARKE